MAKIGTKPDARETLFLSFLASVTRQISLSHAQCNTPTLLLLSLELPLARFFFRRRTEECPLAFNVNEIRR